MSIKSLPQTSMNVSCSERRKTRVLLPTRRLEWIHQLRVESIPSSPVKIMSMPCDQTSPPALEITQHDIANAKTGSTSDHFDAACGALISSTDLSVRVVVFKLQTCYCSACIHKYQNNGRLDQAMIPEPSRFFRKSKIYRGQDQT